MAAAVQHLDVVYCLGWDPGPRAVVVPIGHDRARARDASGEPYAVLLLAAGRPWALLEISWAVHACTVWRFDGQSRRDARRDLRLLADGDLFLIGQVAWHYPDVDRPELDPTAARRTCRYTLEGVLRDIDEPGGDLGGSMHRTGTVPVEALRQPRPGFGDWASLVDPLGEVAPTAVIAVAESLPDGVAVSALTEAPPPPRPLQPRDLDRLFLDGARYRFADGSDVTAEVHDAGRLRMPSGSLVAMDPTWSPGDAPPYTVGVAPGTYPVILSVVRWAEQPGHVRVAAAKLLVTDEPVATWEPALRPGQDPRLLGDDEFYGFGVDAGLGCFVDSVAAGAVPDLFDRDRDVFAAVSDERAGDFAVPASGANVIVYSSGWGDGSYPTWVGRARSGEVACFVADMLVVHDAVPTGAD